LIIFYQNNISPKTPNVCRFNPSCSEYTKQAIAKYGWIRGINLGMKRIGRCKPNGGSGYDPLP